MTLKEKLGETEYAELVALMKPPDSEVMAWLKGSVKSWTMWFGSALIAFPLVAPDLLVQLKDVLSPEQFKYAAQIIGFLVILLRLKTTASLKAKGTV